jgi:putative transposase
MSIKAYKYRIYAHPFTTAKLQWTLDRCRELYNAALIERRDAYEMHVKRHSGYYDEETRKQLTCGLTVDYYGQKRDLVEIKELRPEYQEIASHVLQDVILRLKRAYDNFFRRVQKGEEPGYPRIQGRNRYDSFTYPDGAGWKLDAKERPADKKGIVRVTLKLTKIGTVKLQLHRNTEGTIKTLTIKREGEHWYAIFTCEVGKPSHEKSAEVTGVRKPPIRSLNITARLLINAKTFSTKLHANWSIGIRSSSLKTYK